MMKMLETQVGQLAGHLTNNEGKLPGQPKDPESAKAILPRFACFLPVTDVWSLLTVPGAWVILRQFARVVGP
jgi:hypothetical protein